MDNYVIGLDYGTDSVRAVVVNASDGSEISSAVSWYPRWKQGLYCNPQRNQYRQHPLDYIDSMIEVVREAIAKAPSGTAQRIAGIAFDTTGSTPVLTDCEGVPLALQERFRDHPDAMFILWKDHTAVQEAEEINELSRSWHTDYTKYEGGIYSSEWVWAKILHILRHDPDIADASWSWIEHCDWMPALLTGRSAPAEVVRSRCAAGHKAMWHSDFGGLPDSDFLNRLDPRLGRFRERLYTETCPADKKVGTLTKEWAEKLGLSGEIAVAAGAFDAHIGAVGGGIRPKTLLRVMGTSTCDMIVAPGDVMEGRLIRGICGQVDGSILPGMVGLEAGQSAFGDVYAWFGKLLYWPLQFLNNPAERDEILENLLDRLSLEASKIPDDLDLPIANDWFNGRRTPDADQSLKATITGLTLGTDAPMVFKSLVEATAFGSRAIVERFRDEGVEIEEVIAIGGVARKSAYVMQVLANVLQTRIKVARSGQACALGAAMFAATAAGLYASVGEAQASMEQGFDLVFEPDLSKKAFYDRRYNQYLALSNLRPD